MLGNAQHVHVVASKWGAGGILSNVDTVISMCIRSHSLVCSAAFIGGIKGEARGKEKDRCFGVLEPETILPDVDAKR